MIQMKNGKFLYVFDVGSRDKLLKAGYTMLASDEKNAIFVFIGDSSAKIFTLDDVEHVYSNTLTF